MEEKEFRLKAHGPKQELYNVRISERTGTWKEYVHFLWVGGRQINCKYCSNGIGSNPCINNIVKLKLIIFTSDREVWTCFLRETCRGERGREQKLWHF